MLNLKHVWIWLHERFYQSRFAETLTPNPKP